LKLTPRAVETRPAVALTFTANPDTVVEDRPVPCSQLVTVDTSAGVGPNLAKNWPGLNQWWNSGDFGL
jgi:hypothetical protein